MRGVRLAFGWPTCLAVFGGMAGLALLAILYRNYEVVEKGQLLDYTSGLIYRIRFFDRYTLYVEPESRLTPDAVNAFLLTGIGFVSLTFATLLARMRAHDAARSFHFFVLMGLGAIYLAADEFLGIHETLGHNLPFLAELPFVHRPDDAVVIFYVAAVFGFLFAFRDVLVAWRGTRLFAAAAAVLAVMAAIGDTLAWRTEELIEIAVTLCVIAATLQLGADVVAAAAEGSAPHHHHDQSPDGA